MSRDVGAYCTLVALVCLLFVLTTQDSRELPFAVRHEDQPSPISTVNEYFTDLEQRLSRFRQNTGYAIKLVEVSGVAPQHLGVLATEQLSVLQKKYPESKGSVVVIMLTTGDGSAIETSETLRDRFSKQEVEGKITAILQGRSSQTLTTERVVHVILEHLNLWFYVMDPSKSSTFLVRFPIAEMILLVFAPVLGC